MADQSIQIGDHANLQRAAAIALGVNSLASYNSNNPTNITGSSIVAVNLTPPPGGSEFIQWKIANKENRTDVQLR
ncbi:hypothetical protein M378DRAFT_162398 [Amanita muscaria Koide BX008]|uniref:Uncharacterized protein n=1 Tax=Amanita muscaria (strain Koide BX008) TaxID=946122 RepID=A0A0C2TE87_AMAMK|nr:hypothetical protein M378DRAFT_162398 [Amanita muscaria Koide BX008]